MKEIGGYIELDTYTGAMLHEDGILLNCGRNALSYVIQAKRLKKIYMPKFMCDSNNKVLQNNGVEVEYYHIGQDFRPIIDKYDGCLYVVNFYGQLDNTFLGDLGDNLIVDNAQAYFQEPIQGIDTLYTCRKFFGVPDGAVLYTDTRIDVDDVDESFERMRFLLGRFERSASEFYREYIDNNKRFNNEPLKRMSRLTRNLLHSIDYNAVKNIRTSNFSFVNERLKNRNKLNLVVPEGAFMYPFYIENGSEIRSKLQEKKIFIPTLWPSVFDICEEDELEYDMANNILPLPIDQRYSIEDMDYMIEVIEEFV